MVGRVLTQVRHQQAKLVLVTPIWRTQTWYLVLLEMLVRIPLLLPNIPSERFPLMDRARPQAVVDTQAHPVSIQSGYY